jgi:hypothetical protein
MLAQFIWVRWRLIIPRFDWNESPFDRNLYPESGTKKFRELGIQRLAATCIVPALGRSLVPQSAPSLEVRPKSCMW